MPVKIKKRQKADATSTESSRFDSDLWEAKKANISNALDLSKPSKIQERKENNTTGAISFSKQFLSTSKTIKQQFTTRNLFKVNFSVQIADSVKFIIISFISALK